MVNGGGCKWPYCLTFGFLMFFGLLLNSQNNLFAFSQNAIATLHFDPNGGTWLADGVDGAIDIVEPYDTLVESSRLPELTKVGFKFGGWFDHSGNQYEFPIKIPEGETTLVAKWNFEYKLVEFKLQKTFASGGRQFFAAIGTAAGKQSPSQSIPEFLKSNVVANMFLVKRAADSSVKEGEETSLTNKTTALAAKEDDLGYYVITDVAYTDGSNSFTVTFNVVVPVGDTLGVIRLRENADFAPGLFTVTYSDCDLSYANLTEPSSSAS